MKKLNFKQKIKKVIRSNGFLLAVLLVLLGIVARLVPHAPNFAPIGAIALFSAMYLPKRFAFLLPITAMLMSDIIIGFYNPKIMAAIYLSFILMGIIGLWVKKNKSLVSIGAGTLAGSIAFFLITNTAVWMFGTMYSPDLTGLISSFVNAIPFFRSTLLGNFFYVAVLVGSYELITWWAKKPVLKPSIVNIDTGKVH